MQQPRTKGRIIGLALILLMLATAPRIMRGYEAALALADLTGYSVPSLLDPRPQVRSQALEFTVDTRRYQADSYQPSDPARAGLLLVHGLIADGRKDPRLQAFARTLARAGFFVLAPDIPTLRHLQLLPETIDEIGDAFTYLSSNPTWAPQGRAGIAAISIALGPALLAKRPPQANQAARFVLGIGGYYDLPRLLRYHTTGHYPDPGGARGRPPNERAKWAFVHSYAGRLGNPAETLILQEIATLKWHDPQTPVEALREQLSGEGRALLAFVDNRDPAQVDALLSHLPQRIQQDVASLNLAAQDLSGLSGRLLLVHGEDDDIIPAAESVALARALPPERTRLFLLGGLQHVDASTGAVNAWHLWQALDALLAEREH